jgi:uncharacterized protein
MKALLVALLLAAGLLCPCAEAQQDEAKQKQFLEDKANAEKGDAAAQYFLGLDYYFGKGVEKDQVEGVKWFRKAAEQGHADAQSNLGVCYHDGEGVAKDYAEAVKWYRKAGAQGNAVAQLSLGYAYHKGEGVEKDFVEAYAWWNLASTTEEKAAKNRDILEKTMSPQQVADAQKRTKELRGMIEANAKAKAGK